MRWMRQALQCTSDASPPSKVPKIATQEESSVKKPMQLTTISASDLIAQRQSLKDQETAMIQELLDRCESMAKEYEEATTQIAADLKALGWHRTREAKAATESATAIDKPKRARKGKAA